MGPTANVDEDFHLVVGWPARSSCSESIKAFGKRFEEATAGGCPALFKVKSESESPSGKSEKNNMGSKFDPLQYGSGSDGEDDDDDDDDAVEDATKPAAAPSKPKVRMIEHFNGAQPSPEPAHHTPYSGRFARVTGVALER